MYDDLPSGFVKIAIEHGHWNSGFAHEKWWFSSSLCKRLPEGMYVIVCSLFQFWGAITWYY